MLAEILDTPFCNSVAHSPEFKVFEEKVDRAAIWLLAQVVSDPSSLWSPYTFSNAYIAYGLRKLVRHKPIDLNCTATVVDWFHGQQGRSGGFEDSEDTALAILALTQMVKQRQLRSDRSIRNILLGPPEGPCGNPKCFIGYGGQSGFLASDIKDFLSRMMPNLTIRDWKWDFQLGQLLFTEIDAASRECSVAIFLITKDDEVKRSGNQIASPRDI